jgi:hypothetical protein
VQHTGTLDEDGIRQLIAVLLPDTPAAHVRIVLAYQRRQGVEFDAAWTTAMKSLPRADPSARDWRPALRATREAWRSAYDAEVLAVV